MRKPRTPRWLVRVLVIEAVLASMLFIGPGVAQAATDCGTSANHNVCVTAPDVPLTGEVTITVTNDPNNGVVIATWIPQGKAAITLIQDFAPSPGTDDYSFTWPTEKYLDASGVLRVQANNTNSTPVEVPVTLLNGNLSDFQHSPSDWESFLPNPVWTDPADPVIAAVGDGASGESAGADLAQSIAASDPALFLYLGDIYETGTFTEHLNHYGQNSMDGGPGTLWGAMGTITQPAMGDHEAANSNAWQDYFHGRPLYTSFEFANVLFLDLASSGVSMASGSPQYNYVKSVLTSPTTPACVVTYFQNPVLAKSSVNSHRTAIWKLLTDNGGDLVFNGNSHTMIQYKPLNDQVQLPSSGQETMVELIDGSGGHGLGAAFTNDPRVEWSKGKTPGAVYLGLDGAANDGTPTSLSWDYKDKNGNVLHSGTRDCGGGPPPPPGPSISGFSPTSGPIGASVQIAGSGFTGTNEVTFGGATADSFTVDSDAQITATVPANAVTGPISVTTGVGSDTSQADFTVTGAAITFGPDADTYVRSDKPAKNFGAAITFLVDASPVTDSLLRFTVSGVGAGPVASAKLRIYCTDGSGAGGNFYEVTDNSWPESTVTWSTAPTADTTLLGSLAKVVPGTWYEVDVSSFVTGDGTYSLEITSPSANSAAYSSKEGTAGFAPQLVVTLPQ
jgi:IPT/TIG domain